MLFNSLNNAYLYSNGTIEYRELGIPELCLFLVFSLNLIEFNAELKKINRVLRNRVNIIVTNLDAEHFTTFGDIVNILDGYFLIRVHYFLYKTL